MRVLIQLRSTPHTVAAAAAGEVPAAAPFGLGGLVIDPDYPAVPIPRARPDGGARLAFEQPTTYSQAPEDATYVVRGQIPDADPAAAQQLLAGQPDVVGVYSDPVIETCRVCPGSPAVGTDADVATQLGVPGLGRPGSTATGCGWRSSTPGSTSSTCAARGGIRS